MFPPLLAVVDDDDDLRELLDELFRQEGYRTLQVPDSAGAQAAIRQAQPDVIFLDLWLERQDSGLALLDQLRADPATRHLPVIVCSAITQSLHVQAARVEERGCLVVAKPFDLEDLLAAVRQALSQPRLAPSAPEAGPAPEAAESEWGRR